MPKPYINQRRQAEMVPQLMAQVSALGGIITYLVNELGGQVTIPRASLRELVETKNVSTDSDPDSETLELFIEETPS